MSDKNLYQYYVSLDSYINVERLEALNNNLTTKIDEIQRTGDGTTGLFAAGERLDPTAPQRAGTQTIGLRRQINGGYKQLHEADCWEDTKCVNDFPELMDFIRDLPFVSFGRAFAIFDYDGIAEPVHRDHGDPDLHQEFIWFRPNKTKKFYIYDKAKHQKNFVESFSCWFDTRHYHGVDPADGLSISIRVDGVFTETLRAVINQNKALVPPKDLTIAEKIKRRWYFFRQKSLNDSLASDGRA